MPFYSQAPARVDLAGGTLDIWPLYLFHKNSQTINFAIQCYARCRLTPRRGETIELISHDLGRHERFSSLEAMREARRWKLPLLARLVMAFAGAGMDRRNDIKMSFRASPLQMRARMPALPQGFRLETDSDVPAGSGLGGSSALNIAICGALAKFTGARLAAHEMIALARNVEAQVLGVPTGEQDYYAAMFGGLQVIYLTSHGIWPEKMKFASEEINSRFILCYTGESRNSGINNWEVEKAHIDGNRKVVRHIDRIAAIAAEMRSALVERDWNATGRLLDLEWQARKKNHSGITTPAIERLMAIARRHGAMAGKACGAGGGGCIVFLVEPETKRNVEAALEHAGARLLPSRIATRGLQVRQAQ
ncbi:MAG: GHMP kinase [Acidobacteria bacterium]|nr:GHMP kinase [Acidobacteriota bacterium]